jgi:hypothetical protein
MGLPISLTVWLSLVSAPTFSPNEAGAFTQIQISATNAHHICYMTGAGDPTCAAAGECNTGAVKINTTSSWLPLTQDATYRVVACDGVDQASVIRESPAYSAGALPERFH